MKTAQRIELDGKAFRDSWQILDMEYQAIAKGEPFWRPARWFKPTVAERVRAAAQPGRKSKAVESTIFPDGTTMYSARDAHKWWPHDVPDPSLEDL